MHRQHDSWRSARTLIILAASVSALACSRAGDQGQPAGSGGRDQEASARARPPATNELPPGHPPIHGQLDPGTLPLRETGSGSQAELDRGREGTQDPRAREAFTDGFRLIFTTDSQNRDYVRARDLFVAAITLDSTYAEAYRGLAYAEFNVGFNRDAAVENYLKAIELKPDYGEAHYALAFIYAMGDLEQGSKHLKKALELGVEDERNLIEQFYPGLKRQTGREATASEPE